MSSLKKLRYGHAWTGVGQREILDGAKMTARCGPNCRNHSLLLRNVAGYRRTKRHLNTGCQILEDHATVTPGIAPLTLRGDLTGGLPGDDLNCRIENTDTALLDHHRPKPRRRTRCG